MWVGQEGGASGSGEPGARESGLLGSVQMLRWPMAGALHRLRLTDAPREVAARGMARRCGCGDAEGLTQGKEALQGEERPGTALGTSEASSTGPCALEFTSRGSPSRLLSTTNLEEVGWTPGCRRPVA